LHQLVGFDEMPTPDSAELDQLMQRLAEGDRAAFKPVFQTLWPIVYRMCLNLTKNAADAEDTAQQTLQKILAQAADYDPTRPALPWALVIATWECRTVLRKRMRRREDGERELAEQAAPHRLDEEFTQRDLVQAAQQALEQLSPTDRETLVATFWDEAAPVSGATLRKRRERALGRLRASFRRLYGLS
jgi:RNA polymerase sigma-70 factor (ECF subfamily)